MADIPLLIILNVVDNAPDLSLQQTSICLQAGHWKLSTVSSFGINILENC